jgi:hypothetical protein
LNLKLSAWFIMIMTSGICSYAPPHGEGDSFKLLPAVVALLRLGGITGTHC